MATFYTDSGSFNGLEVTGSTILSGSLVVTGSANFNFGLTGSLFGTASSANSASVAITSSYAANSIPPFPFSGSAVITGSLFISQSISGTPALRATGSIDFVTGSTRINTAVTNINLNAGNGLGSDANISLSSIGSAIAVISAGDAIVQINDSGVLPIGLSKQFGDPGDGDNNRWQVYSSFIDNSGTITTTAFTASNAKINGSVSASSYTSSLNNQVGFLGTSSFAVSASRTVTSSYAISSSYIESASFDGYINFGNGLVVTGSTTLSGSGIALQVTGSTVFRDNVTVNGGTLFVDAVNNRVNVSGSLVISASQAFTASNVQLTNLTDTTSANKVLVLNTTTNQVFTTASVGSSGGGSGNGFPFTGSAIITGSLLISQSTQGAPALQVSGGIRLRTGSITVYTSVDGGTFGGFYVDSGTGDIAMEAGGGAYIGSNTSDVNLFAQGVGTAFVGTQEIRPQTNLVQSLGTSAIQWNRLHVGTVSASTAVTAPIISASSALTASHVQLNGLTDTTSANKVLVIDTTTNKVFTTASINALSASFATTASFTLNSAVTSFTNGADNRVITATGPTGITGESTFTFDGSVGIITGSLIVSSSTTTPAIRTTGSINVTSGSLTLNASTTTAGTNGIRLIPAGGGGTFDIYNDTFFSIINSSNRILYFKVNEGSGIYWNGQAFAPNTSNQESLGNIGTNGRWKDLFVGDIFSSGSIIHTGSLIVSSSGIRVTGSVDVISGGVSASGLLANGPQYIKHSSGSVVGFVKADPTANTVSFGAESFHVVNLSINGNPLYQYGVGAFVPINAGYAIGNSTNPWSSVAGLAITGSIISASTALTASHVQLNGLADTTAANKVLVLDTATNKIFTTTSVGASGGGGGNAFGTIAVAGQSNVAADQANDTLTLVAGTNVTITTDASTDSITINSAGGSGTPFPYDGRTTPALISGSLTVSSSINTPGIRVTGSIDVTSGGVTASGLLANGPQYIKHSSGSVIGFIKADPVANVVSFGAESFHVVNLSINGNPLYQYGVGAFVPINADYALGNQTNPWTRATITSVTASIVSASAGITGSLAQFNPVSLKITVGTTEPSSPAVNDLWVDTN